MLHRTPTPEEITLEMQQHSIDKNITRLIDINNTTTVFLDAPTSFDDQSLLSENFSDPTEKESNIEQEVTREHQQYYASELLKVLAIPEQNILKMYYGLSPYTHAHTLSEIAEKCDMTTEGIRNKIHKSLKIMKHSPL